MSEDTPKKHKREVVSLHMSNDIKSMMKNIVSEISKAIDGSTDIIKLNPSDIQTTIYGTGMLSLDKALGVSGLLGGRIVNCYGEAGTGKTLTAMVVAGCVQRGGGTVAYIDSEGCITGDSQVLDPILGHTVNMVDVVTGDTSTSNAMSIDYDNMQSKQVPISAAVNSGIQECLEIKTRHNASIKATLDHPVIVAGKGWTRLDNIQIGDFIARPKQLNITSTEPSNDITPEVCKIIGYLLGDGCLINSSPRMSIYDHDILNDIKELVKTIDQFLQVNHVGATKGSYNIVNTNIDNRDQIGSNKLLNILKRLGMMNIKNQFKRIPYELITLDEIYIKYLLAGLIMSDGHSHKNRAEIDFSTSSKILAQQVKFLFSRLGVVSSIYTKVDKRKETYLPSYRVVVYNANNINKLQQLPLVGYKLDNNIVNGDRRQAQSRQTAIPQNIILNIVVPELKRRGITSREFKEKLGYSIHKKGYRLSTGHTVPYHIIDDIYRLFDIDMRKWLPDDIWWDRVVSIKNIGQQQVYDLSINTTHNFIANDIIVHNTFSPVFARSCGLDVENLIYIRSTPDHVMTGEDFFEVIRVLVSQGVHFILVDSGSALVPSQKLQLSFGEGQQATQARMFSEELQKLTAYLSANQRTILWFTNQMRSNPMQMFGAKDSSTGGKALGFYASYNFQMTKEKDLKVKVKSFDGRTEERNIGVAVKLYVKKNKTAPIPCEPIQFEVYTEFATLEDGTQIEPGVNILKDIFQVGKALGVITQKSSWFTYDDIKANGETEFCQTIKNRPDIIQKLRDQVLRGNKHE
jgi:RecA/RadA recombinase